MIKISITFQVVTPESAERGDFSETGFVHENLEFENIEELISDIREYGYMERGNETDFYTTDPEIDYYDGSETTHGIHFDDKNTADIFWNTLRGKKSA